MEINATHFILNADPFDYSRSAAEFGNNAGVSAWKKALSADFVILKTEDEKEAFKKFISGFGAWDDAEIASWDDLQLNALAVQFLSGDMREPVGFEIGPDTSIEEWEDYYQQSEEGIVSGRLFKSENGTIYWSIDA